MTAMAQMAGAEAAVSSHAVAASKDGQLEASPKLWRRLSLGIAVFHCALAAFVILRGFFYVDDYIFLARATLNPAFSDAMLEPWAGHLMPGGLLITWVLAHLAPLNYGAFAAVAIAAQIACTLLFRLVALRLLGSGAAHAIAVALYASSMAILVASTWWAAALNALPMQICLLVVLLLTVGSRSRSIAKEAAAIAALALALFFFEKSLLIPIVILGVAWARSEVAHPVRALLAVLGERKALWAGFAVLMLGYLAVYSASGASDPIDRGQYSALRTADIIGRSFPTLAADLLGGPWRWQINFEAFQNISSAALIVSVQVIALGFAAGVALRGRGFWRWVVVGLGYVAATLTLLIIGRSSAGAMLVTAPRYFTDTALVLSLAAGGALSTCRRPSSVPSKVQDASAAGLCVALVASALASVSGVLSWLDQNPTRRYVSGGAADLRALTQPTQILDIPVPDSVIGALVAPLNRASSIFGLVSPHAEFTRQLDEVRFLDPSGTLTKGRVAGVQAPPGPEACGWRFVGAGFIRIPPTPSVGAVSLAYSSDRDTPAAISVGGEPIAFALRSGEHETNIAVDGSGEVVGIKAEDPQAAICVKALTAGWPLPS